MPYACTLNSLQNKQDPKFLYSRNLGSFQWWRRRDSNPLHSNDLHHTEPRHNGNRNGTNPCITKHLRKEEFLGQDRTHAVSKQNPNRCLRSECVKCVSLENAPRDLKVVMKSWSELPESIRTAILSIVRSSTRGYK